MIKWHLKKNKKIKNILRHIPTSPLLEKHYLIDGLRKLKKQKILSFQHVHIDLLLTEVFFLRN